MIVRFQNVCQVKRVPDRMQVTSCEKDAVQSRVKSQVLKNLTFSITSHRPKAAGREEDKDQESIQLSITPDPEHHITSRNKVQNLLSRIYFYTDKQFE